jgi:hypothetical protein
MIIDAPTPLPRTALNSLKRGHLYLITTLDGAAASGRYLGIEVMHDDWSLLLSGPDATHSIDIRRLAAVERVA